MVFLNARACASWYISSVNSYTEREYAATASALSMVVSSSMTSGVDGAVELDLTLEMVCSEKLLEDVAQSLSAGAASGDVASSGVSSSNVSSSTVPCSAAVIESTEVVGRDTGWAGSGATGSLCATGSGSGSVASGEEGGWGAGGGRNVAVGEM